jgi:hypothetical protein
MDARSRAGFRDDVIIGKARPHCISGIYFLSIPKEKK